jgi:hypothetical protein
MLFCICKLRSRTAWQTVCPDELLVAHITKIFLVCTELELALLHSQNHVMNRILSHRIRSGPLSLQLLYFSIDNAHLMHNAHPKLFRHFLLCIYNARDAN